MRASALVAVAGLAIAALAATAVASSNGPVTETAPKSERVLDLRLLCAVSIVGGIPVMEIEAFGRKRGVGQPWERARFHVYSGFGNSRDYTFAHASSGDPVRPGGPSFEVGRACRATTRSVALSSSGLRVQSIGRNGAEVRCFTPKHVLVRVRAVFRSPTRLRRTPYGRGTNTPVREASAAVRTESGKLVAFVSASETGTTRLAAYRDCFAD
jgi:hypothetical protein